MSKQREACYASPDHPADIRSLASQNETGGRSWQGRWARNKLVMFADSDIPSRTNNDKRRFVDAASDELEHVLTGSDIQKNAERCKGWMLVATPDDPVMFSKMTSLVARQLAIIGDEVNERYESEFNRILHDITVTTGSNHGNVLRSIFRFFSGPPISDVIDKSLSSAVCLITSDKQSDFVALRHSSKNLIQHLTELWNDSSLKLVCTGVVLSSVVLLAYRTAHT